MCDCLQKQNSTETDRESVDLFRARVGNTDPETRLRLIFREFQELESDVCRQSKISRSKSDWFWWFNVGFTMCMVAGSAAVTIVTAFTEEKNIPILVLGAILFFLETIRQFLKLGDRGFTYREGNYRLQRVRQQIRDIIYQFQNYNPEQLLVLASEIRNKVDEIDIDLYRSNMTGNVKFEPEIGIVLSERRDSNHPPEVQPSEIHIHLDSQNSSPNNTPGTTPRQSPYFQRHIQKIGASDSELVKSRHNSLRVPHFGENQSAPVINVGNSSE